MASYVFPKVDEVVPPHSRRDLSLYKLTTTSIGVLSPILNIEMLPDDWMRVRTYASVETLPMLGPVKGRWKMSFDYYYEPWSNLYGYMDNNAKMTTENILTQGRWLVAVGGMQSDSVSSTGVRDSYNQSYFLEQLYDSQRIVGSSSLFDYLGSPVGFMGYFDTNGQKLLPHRMPAEGFLTYLDIIRNYYVNNQEDIVPFVLGDEAVYDDGETEYGRYGRVSLTLLDDYFANLRYQSRKGIVERLIPEFDWSISPSSWLSQVVGASHGVVPAISILQGSNVNLRTSGRLGGLFCRTYRMDLLRGIMNGDVGEYESYVDVSNGNFTITDLQFANKLQALINRIDITGGRFSDWIRTRWNVKPGIEVDRPIYLGSHSTWLDTMDVIATASGSSGSQNANSESNLGQQVAYGSGAIQGERPIVIKSNQYGTLMCIMSIVPDVIYSQGFELNNMKSTFSDIFDPAFNQLGYQDVFSGEFSAFSATLSPDYNDEDLRLNDAFQVVSRSSNDLRTVVGKRVAWSEYMASLPRSHGDYAQGESLDWWNNVRRYTDENKVEWNFENSDTKPYAGQVFGSLQRYSPIDTTTYIYPHLWNSIFADNSYDAQNWLVSVRFDIEANRALGKRLMPHL